MTPMQHQQQDERLIRMETKLDIALKQLGLITEDHEARLRSLERRSWIAIGFAAASTGISVLAQINGGAL